jgi:hypothetical protein
VLGGCVAQTWNLTFASGITGSNGSVGLRPAAFIIRTAAGNTLQRYREALENYAYVDKGLKMAGKLGHLAKEANDGDAWLNSIDSTRATRQLDTTNPKTNQKVPAPDPNATSLIATRAPKTTLINPATAGLENGKTMTMGYDNSTKRF